MVTFRDRLRDQAEELHASSGAGDLVRSLSETPVLAAPVRCQATSPLSEGGSIDVDIALQWDWSGQSHVLGFVNTAEMNCGGAHEHGHRRGLKRAFPRLMRRRPEAAASGLTAVVSVLHPRPRLRGTSHVSLESEEVGAVVARAVEIGLDELGRSPDEVARLTEWLRSR
ncbi:MAG: hypothetical protein KIT58_19830 [Planctomycetota bacterium]|nr:hypothetical protein [Planctomycetota bacterium]